MVQTRLYVLFVSKEVGDVSFPSQRQIHSVKIAGSHPRKRERGFAKCFTGNGTCIGAGASQFVMTINHGNSLPKCGCGRGSDNSGGATANDDEVKFS
jgi:hypothetical protein